MSFTEAPTKDPDDSNPQGEDNWKSDRVPYRSAFRLHPGLSKASSSILTQVRTGKIGLAAFLCSKWVAGFPTPACSCGSQWETARHVVLDCPNLLRAPVFGCSYYCLPGFNIATAAHHHRPRNVDPSPRCPSLVLIVSEVAGCWLLASHPLCSTVSQQGNAG